MAQDFVVRQASRELYGKLMRSDKLQGSVRQVMEMQSCGFAVRGMGGGGITLITRIVFSVSFCGTPCRSVLRLSKPLRPSCDLSETYSKLIESRRSNFTTAFCIDPVNRGQHILVEVRAFGSHLN